MKRKVRTFDKDKEKSADKGKDKSAQSSDKDQHAVKALRRSSRNEIRLTAREETGVSTAISKLDAALTSSLDVTKKTVAISGDKKTVSGFAEVAPEGFDRATTDQVRELGDSFFPKFNFPNGGANDQGEVGRYYASHAEKQMAVLKPNEPIGVSKPMCKNCRNFFSQLAIKRGKEQIVSDPNVTRVFHTDGTVTEIFPSGTTHYSDDPDIAIGKEPNVSAVVACPDRYMLDPDSEGVNKANQNENSALSSAMEIAEKTVAISEGHKVVSGFTEEPPEGFERATTDQVRELAHDLNEYEFTNGGASDQGEVGRYYASHAEKQAAVLSPNKPIGVSKPMCLDCRKFFRELAKEKDKIQIVADPEKTRIFKPDGSIIEVNREGKVTGKKLPSSDP